MKIAVLIARLLLGLIFVVFGSNVFFHFLPMPPMHGAAADFMGAMAKTGYFSVVGALQVAGGALLLLGKYVPLGLTLLGPVIVNIILFHLFMDPSGLPLALVVAVVMSLFLLWSRRASFSGLLQA